MDYPLLEQYKRVCKKVSVMQESYYNYWQDSKIIEQIWYYNFLVEMDLIFCHNEVDLKYYRGFTGRRCEIMPTLMITDFIKTSPKKTESVMMGGNFCYWYGGFDSYIVAQEFQERGYVPSMGRKIEGEEEMDNLTHLPYMSWTHWLTELSKRRYGVHLMRTHAAGTFALNCAYLGIPCIGYKGLDTQEICHPSLTVEVGDLYKAKQLLAELKINSYLYDIRSAEAKENYNKYYHEDKFNTAWKK